MTSARSPRIRRHIVALACTTILPALISPGIAHAQNAGAAPQMPDAATAPAVGTVDTAPNTPTSPEPGPVAAPVPQASTSSDGGLQEIVVTAQRREQRLQDVPIAITAITQDKLQANRVVQVTDLSGIAPNVTVRQSAGASQIPSFTSRGITSYGVVPGSDKEFSIYLDGVYLGSSHSLFQLPDIERIEVLRGPQGTLFGRNSTSGAVSVVTRDPAGTFGIHQDFTTGNYSQFRSRTSIDTPSFGPFSAYISYVHDERRGDIRNVGVGTFQDRTGPQTLAGAATSPRYLGGHNQEQVFAAVKFEPSDTFKTIYKFDYGTDRYSPQGTAFVSYNPNSPLIGSLLQALITSQPTPVLIDANAKRPKYVNNAFVTEARQKVYGHNLTSELRLSDNLSLKNIAAYRYSFVNSTSQLDGLGGLVFTPQALVPYATLAAFSTNPGLATAPPAVQGATIGAYAAGLSPLVGQRFTVVGNSTQSLDKQYSDELQANYNSSLLTLTVGGLYFHQTGRTGGPRGLVNTPTFSIFPNSGRAALGNQSVSYNRATSIAAYAQAEVHLTPQLDIVLGGRETHDRKSGDFLAGGTYVFPAGQPTNYTDGSITGLVDSSFKYKGSKFTYSGGVNYKPSRNLLVYGKYSTGFVSGGQIADLPWRPETVRSIEAGIKADLFDRRLRTNLALFDARYKNIQSAQGGTNVGRPDLGTAIIDLGNEHARGVEAEVTLVPFRGLTLNGNLGYTDAKYTSFQPLFRQLIGSGYKPTLSPKFTSDVSAQYESEPLFGSETRFVARADGNWRSTIQLVSGSTTRTVAAFAPLYSAPPRWILNTRIGFSDIGPTHLNLSFWTRNLTNNKSPEFPLTFADFLASSTFEAARTYGLDVSLRF